jgi:6-pyruvoyltetrahydropterin/6-carboxytetrahydropterin synthase
MNLYKIHWEDEISCAHNLELDYESKCNRVHGHNYKIEVDINASLLNDQGMVIDFSDIKKIVFKLDHRNLNDFIKQPTAENIAKYLCERIKNHISISTSDLYYVGVRVYEDRRSYAEYHE